MHKPLYLTFLRLWEKSDFVVFISRYKPSRIKRYKEMHSIKVMADQKELRTFLEAQGMDKMRKFPKSFDITKLFNTIRDHFEQNRAIYHCLAMLDVEMLSSRKIIAKLNQKGIKYSAKKLGQVLSNVKAVKKKQVRINGKPKWVWIKE